MHLTALVDNPNHVCCRYRLSAFEPFLQAAGHRLTLASLPSSWLGRLKFWRSLASSDAVILQRKLLSAWDLHFLARAARCLIFDFDDAIFLHDSYSSRAMKSPSRWRRFEAIVRKAAAVTAGNRFLCNEAMRAFSGSRTTFIPTCVDPARYTIARHARAFAGVQLVWIGSSSTLQGLESVQPLLEQIGQRCFGLSLKLICDRFLHLRHLPVIPCAWQEAREADELAAADIGISWLPDDLWSRGKCGLKILQYMAAGLPVVANPVGVQAEMVEHGKTGLLAETAGQWIEAIGRLAADPALRTQMGLAGRERLEKLYSVRVGASRWLDLLETLRQVKEAA